MILYLHSNVSRADREDLLGLLARRGARVVEATDPPGRVLALVGEEGASDPAEWERHPAVERVLLPATPYHLVHRDFHPERPGVRAGELLFGGEKVPVIAGPCSVEVEIDLVALARFLRDAGASALRGGAYKMRTSPYTFQGLGEEGLARLAEARQATGLPVVTEVADPRDLDRVCRIADVVQVGARSAQNISLLKEVGRAGKPVLLKRGMMSTLGEYLLAAEHVVAAGNDRVILCERGIRTFEGATRNTLDLSAVPVLQRESWLPVIVDPSHGTGHRRWVAPMALAAVAAGADGLMIEVHPDPDAALSDGDQSLLPETFHELMDRLRRVASAVGREM
ncbi:MAG: 3-deoxy-7-phosphoheptulonate synthase [Candidatus Eisenbacteria bacterium]|nr:3-deoxy-7-phosphoheptulonate synthase [Candidatus Eisenbacteria bacterium]